jgi:hypothetical protein
MTPKNVPQNIVRLSLKRIDYRELDALFCPANTGGAVILFCADKESYGGMDIPKGITI